jgi:outer membrane receptor for ferrienterochelin and colicin
MRGLIPGVAFTELGSSAISARVALVRIAACAALGTFLCLWSSCGCADELLPSAIRAQPLGAALAEFAHQTGLQLVYMSDVLQKQQSKGSRAGVSTAEALTALLDGTGLTFEFLNDRAVRIFPTSPRSEGSGAGPRPSAPPLDPRPNQLEQVDVIGQREKERALELAYVQTVPSSVSLVSGNLLQVQEAQQLVDYVASIPGMSLETPGAPGQNLVLIRGILPFTEAPSVAFYIDDTPVGGTGNWAFANSLSLDLMSYDLERFEVWRGPQGTSIGADSEIGLVRYVLVPPDSRDFQGSIAADVSAIHGAEAPGASIFGAVNVPVVPGELGLRASFYESYVPGYIDNLYTGAKGINSLNRRNGRIAARWQPTEAFSIAVNALWNRIGVRSVSQVTSDKVAVVPNTGDAYFAEQVGSYGDLVDNTALLNPQDKALDLYSVSFHWAPGFIAVHSTTAWSRNEADWAVDSTAGSGSYYPMWSGGLVPAGLALTGRNLSLDKFSEEVSISSAQARHFEWTISGFYTHENAHDHPYTVALDKAYQPIPFFAPFVWYYTSPSTLKEQVLFGNATWHLTARFDLGGGIRLAHYDQSFTVVGGGWNVPTYYDFGESSETDATWAAWAKYRVTSATMLYARVATGLVPGQTQGSEPGVLPVGHDTVANYELGLKTGSPEDKVLADLSVFYIDWRDMQLGSSAGFLVNGAWATSRGFELTTSYSPMSNLQLGYNAAYTRGELDRTTPSTNVLLTGYQLPSVPKWSMSGTAQYTWPLGGSWRAQLGGALRWAGEHYTSGVASRSLGGSPVPVVPSFAALDAYSQITRGPVAFRVFARNLTDKRAYLTRFAVTDAANDPIQIVDKLLQPRTLGVGVSYLF